MQVEQVRWSESSGWQPGHPAGDGAGYDLVLVFASPALLRKRDLLHDLEEAYGQGVLVGCSTGGEIAGTRVLDNALVASAIRFRRARIHLACADVRTTADSFEAGRELARALAFEDLSHAMVFSDGLSVNGSELAEGLNEGLPKGVAATGGLSSDGARLEEGLVLYRGEVRANIAVAIGFYGPSLRVGFGSMDGWDPFGPERLVTASRGNVLYELDGRSALDLYRRYLGKLAAKLPLSALLFPLGVRETTDDQVVVRTILSIDAAERSMTFAGNIPAGSRARFMKANFDRLVDGAIGAAHQSRVALSESPVELAVLVSCVGRKLVMQQRIEEEVEGVRDVVGESAALCGFYSNGEISPLQVDQPCQLLNQTLTVTTFSEAT